MVEIARGVPETRAVPTTKASETLSPQLDKKNKYKYIWYLYCFFDVGISIGLCVHNVLYFLINCIVQR